MRLYLRAIGCIVLGIMKSIRRVLSLAAVAATTLLGHQAQAHFILKAPASFQDQGVLGDPQKTAPCGGAVDETVFHPGHYRIALAQNSAAQLPPNPAVTVGASQCGSVPIQNPPQYPILADGVLAHTAAFGAPQTITVKLPNNITCSKCTLQIVEFMSSHPAPCFYHHCAEIAISVAGDAGAPPSDAGVVTVDSGVEGGGGPSSDAGGAVDSGASDAAAVDSGAGGGGGVDPGDSGGGCATAGAGNANGIGVGLFAMLGIALVGTVRRRRAGFSKRG
jgi:MYXO-CTERM domain-containing protein